MQKARFGNGAARARKLAKLKIPQPRVNLRLFRGGISSAMLWGHQAQGLPPTRRAFLRAKLSRQIGRHKQGNIDVAFDFASHRTRDPESDLLTPQVEAWFRALPRWKGTTEILESGWAKTWEVLSEAQDLWKRVKGPMAATRI